MSVQRCMHIRCVALTQHFTRLLLSKRKKISFKCGRFAINCSTNCTHIIIISLLHENMCGMVVVESQHCHRFLIVVAIHSQMAISISCQEIKSMPYDSLSIEWQYNSVSNYQFINAISNHKPNHVLSPQSVKYSLHFYFLVACASSKASNLHETNSVGFELSSDSVCKNRVAVGWMIHSENCFPFFFVGVLTVGQANI